MSPIFDYQCAECKHRWENIEVWSYHKATKCPKCGCESIAKIIGTPIVRSDPDTVKHSLPDPQPPLEELRGKGTEGYKDKPYASTYLKDYTRRKDKEGNTIWEEKHRQYIDLGKNKKGK